MTSTYRVRTVPTRTVTTVRRQVIDDDGDFFDFPKARAGASEFTTVRHRVTPGGGVVTTTTTTTTTPRRVIRDVSLDGMDCRPVLRARRLQALPDQGSRGVQVVRFLIVYRVCHAWISLLHNHFNSAVLAAQVSFDIGLHFKPDDLSVKTRAGMVFITAKRTDGNITREFDRKVPLPDGVDPLTVRALLSPTGVLTIRSPRNLSSRYTSNIYERHVPVRMSLY
ncbi:hypothetical protein HPB51_023828 [Rhipicephalus microplus]|uniref:SHSP domain-containing protein n=1 Tax=Rhipicephalus microplus TaxID=6941 RepID=A0A9J6ECZ4_RHIMP|nr:hypothetical protein HPB51_023828 [Rhipicephalus microplus]